MKECGAIVAHGKNVEVIAADRETREIDAADGEMRKVAEAARQQRLLNIASDADFLFEALAFAFALDEARVVENAGGFDGEGVENLAVELRERSRAAGIEIQHAEKMAALDVNIDSVYGARHRIQRNDNDGAQTLRDDALRVLKRDVGLMEILR